MDGKLPLYVWLLAIHVVAAGLVLGIVGLSTFLVWDYRRDRQRRRSRCERRGD